MRCGPMGSRASSTASPDLLEIKEDESFVQAVRSLCACIEDTVHVPYTFEQLKTGNGAKILAPLVHYLTRRCAFPYIVSALLCLRYHYKDPDDRGISQARAHACELLAWRVVLCYSSQERLDALLTALPSVIREHGSTRRGSESLEEGSSGQMTPLLHPTGGRNPIDDVPFMQRFAKRQMRHVRHVMSGAGVSGAADGFDSDSDDDPTTAFIGLSALEIAAVADAKSFLSQHVVQRYVDAIWNGDIVFWDSVSARAERRPYFRHKADTDPYCLLRVPRYQTAFETLFFVGLVCLYFVVMVGPRGLGVTAPEILLYIWVVAFTYEELWSLWDTGIKFLSVDLWNMMDIAIVCVAIVFVVTRMIGISRGDLHIVGIAFDILSVMAIPLIPRTFSLLSLYRAPGVLIVSLTQMVRESITFLLIVLVLYIGFASTFVLLARDHIPTRNVLWLMAYLFTGQSYVGLDNASKISSLLGPALMVICVCLTNILLVPTLISLLTNSLTMVISNAHEEYLFQYSILVLESCASKRLTYYYPPLNLVALVLLRPLRLFLPSAKLRSARVVLLKITHAPFVALILLCEAFAGSLQQDRDRWRGKPSASKALGLPQQRHGRGETSLDDLRDADATSRSYPTRPVSGPGPDAEVIAELTNAVAKLADQVKKLEGRIEAQQQQQQQ